VGNKNFTDVTKPSEIVQLLLNDDQLATLNTSTSPSMSTNQGTTEGTKNSAGGPVQDLWNDEEDNFFGHSGTTATTVAPDVVDADTPISNSTRGKKRKTGTTGATRGRKSTVTRRNLEKGATRRAASVKEPAT
jgi:chromatin-remodeling ATPase INO80